MTADLVARLEAEADFAHSLIAETVGDRRTLLAEREALLREAASALRSSGEAVAYRVTDDNGVPRFIGAEYTDEGMLDGYRSAPGYTVRPLIYGDTIPPPAPAAEQDEDDCMNETIGELLAKGFKVTIEPDDDATQPEARGVEGMVPRDAMDDLYRAYVRLLESGRDRIMELGGTCDPVDVMEHSDPYLVRARRALATPNPVRAEQPEREWKLVPVELANQLQPGYWKEVYIGWRHMRAEITLQYDTWERLMKLLAAAPAAPVGVDDSISRACLPYVADDGSMHASRDAADRHDALAGKAQEESK